MSHTLSPIMLNFRVGVIDISNGGAERRREEEDASNTVASLTLLFIAAGMA